MDSTTEADRSIDPIWRKYEGSLINSTKLHTSSTVKVTFPEILHEVEFGLLNQIGSFYE